MSLGKITYYILLVPMMAATVIYYFFLLISLLMGVGVELAREFHKEVKEI